MSRVKWNYNWDKTTLMIYISLRLYSVKPHITVFHKDGTSHIFSFKRAVYFNYFFCLEIT